MRVYSLRFQRKSGKIAALSFVLRSSDHFVMLKMWECVHVQMPGCADVGMGLGELLLGMFIAQRNNCRV